jgi:hypothetical protein
MKTIVAMATVLLAAACQPHVIISTGTTLGLKATPGDGESRPPQVTLGYKRAEVALVPTNGDAAHEKGTDAFSTLAAFDFRTRWFGQTELSSFIATGLTARDIQGDRHNDEFERAFAAATLTEVEQPLQDRRVALSERARGLSDADDRTILGKVGRSIRAHQTAAQAVGEAILVANTETSVKALENAFDAVGH